MALTQHDPFGFGVPHVRGVGNRGRGLVWLFLISLILGGSSRYFYGPQATGLAGMRKDFAAILQKATLRSTPLPPPAPPAATAPAAAKQHRVTILTEPKGAVVEFNGKSFGKSPVTVMAWTNSRLRLRVSKPGFLPAEPEFLVTDSAQFKINLQRPKRTTQKVKPNKRSL